MAEDNVGDAAGLALIAASTSFMLAASLKGQGLLDQTTLTHLRQLLDEEMRDPDWGERTRGLLRRWRAILD